MLNYIKSEFYRNINTKENYLFLFGCSGFVIFINVVLGLYANSQVNFPYGNTKFSLSSFYNLIGIIMIICVFLVSLINGQESKNHTLKNSVSFGVPRGQIYIGKFIVEIVICTINLIVISTVYAIAAYFMLEDSGVIYLKEFIQAIVASFPLLLVSVTAAHCFYFIFDNERSTMMAWTITMVVIPQLTSIAGRRIVILQKISEWMPWNLLGNATYDESTSRTIMSWSSHEGFIKCFIVGAIGIIIFYTIGLVFFNKKEIK